jgi:F0F1-type ATP synthase assembly protein I
MPLLGPDQIKDFGRYGAVGLEMAALVFIGVKAGEWADERFGTEYLTLLGVLLGIAAGFYSLIKLTQRAKRASDARSANEDSTDAASAPESPSGAPKAPPAAEPPLDDRPSKD